jgi:AcrR family transcriptional regulator
VVVPNRCYVDFRACQCWPPWLAKVCSQSGRPPIKTGGAGRIHRHFPKKEDLEAGLWDWIVEHLTHADFAAGNEEQLIAATRESFAGFDAHAGLIHEMLHSPQGLTVRRRQQPARRAMFEACVVSAVPGAPPQVRERAAALQVLYSAPSWELLRGFWDMDATRAADVVELAIRSLFAALRLDARDHATNDQPGSRQERTRP